MVFGILAATVAVPTVVGTTEAVRQGQRQNRNEEHRGRKSELIVSVAPSSKNSKRQGELDGAIVVLWRNRLWIRPQAGEHDASPLDTAHPFNGYFLKHPHQQRWRAAGFDPHGEGLVSTISHDPPILNWIYVDPKTYQIKYGTRPQVDEAQGMPGPWDVTAGIGTDKGTGLLGGGRRMMFEGWEGFVAVEEEVGLSEEPEQVNSSTRELDGETFKDSKIDVKREAEHEGDHGSKEDEEDDESPDDQGELWADAEERSRYTENKKSVMLWGLYFDVKDDGLSSGGRIGAEYWKYHMLEVELTRRERRRTREAAIEERVDRLKQRQKVDEKNESTKAELAESNSTVVVQSTMSSSTKEVEDTQESSRQQERKDDAQPIPK